MSGITTNYKTPFTIISNSSKSIGPQSGMNCFSEEGGGVFAEKGQGFYAGYADYDKDNLTSEIKYLRVGEERRKHPDQLLSDTITKKVFRYGKEVDGRPFIFVFFTHVLTTMDWLNVDDKMTSVIEKLGGGPKWYDLNQKCVYRGSSVLFHISYAMVSLVKMTTDNADFKAITAYESADLGAYSQAGLSLNVNLEWLTTANPEASVIKHFELKDFN